MSFETLDYAVRDRVAEITMRRAPVNAINHALVDDLLAASWSMTCWPPTPRRATTRTCAR